jgi:hypothetical protein
MDRRCDHGQHDRGSRRERQGCPRLARRQGPRAALRRSVIDTKQVWFTANVSLSWPVRRTPPSARGVSFVLLRFSFVAARRVGGAVSYGRGASWGRCTWTNRNAKLDAKNVNAACVLGLGAKTLTRRECSSCIIHYVIRYSRRDRAAPPAARTHTTKMKKLVPLLGWAHIRTTDESSPESISCDTRTMLSRTSSEPSSHMHPRRVLNGTA